MKISIPLSPADFVPLAGFALKDRWTDPKYAVLPDLALNQIRPLTPQKAEEVSDVLLRLIDRTQECLSAVLFEVIESTDTSGEPGVTGKWLLRNVPPNSKGLIVSWLPTVAVVTPTTVFCEFWDDFCYPSSDDITVWSMTDDWAALFHHDGMLQVGQRRTYFCHVCGYSLGVDAPWGDDGRSSSYDICGCCGCEYGYQDCTASGLEAYRELWIASGCKWFDSKLKPAKWSIEEQLKNVPSELPQGIIRDIERWRP